MSEEMPSFLMRSYEALSRGDLDAWLDTYTPDAELRDPPETPDGQVRRGHREIRDWAEGMLEMTEEWHWTPGEVLMNQADVLVVHAHMVGRSRSNFPLDFEIFHLFRIEGDMVASVQGFLDRSSALEAAGLSE